MSFPAQGRRDLRTILVVTTRFEGWPDEALDFFEGLEADNSKSYWESQRSVFEQAVKGPMEALVSELEPEFGVFKIYRPYRDVRFSADKSPYKTHIAAGSGLGAGGCYIDFSVNGLFSGAGVWQMSKDQLVRYRAAIDGAPGSDLEEISRQLDEQGYELKGETLKRAPKGWAPDHPRIKLLRHTSVLVSSHYPPEAWMATAEAKDRITSVWRIAGPLMVWLDANVGRAAAG